MPLSVSSLTSPSVHVLPCLSLHVCIYLSVGRRNMKLDGHRWSAGVDWAFNLAMLFTAWRNWLQVELPEVPEDSPRPRFELPKAGLLSKERGLGKEGLGQSGQDVRILEPAMEELFFLATLPARCYLVIHHPLILSWSKRIPIPYPAPWCSKCRLPSRWTLCQDSVKQAVKACALSRLS